MAPTPSSLNIEPVRKYDIKVAGVLTAFLPTRQVANTPRYSMGESGGERWNLTGTSDFAGYGGKDLEASTC
jgi:hypothetical protein